MAIFWTALQSQILQKFAAPQIRVVNGEGSAACSNLTNKGVVVSFGGGSATGCRVDGLEERAVSNVTEEGSLAERSKVAWAAAVESFGYMRMKDIPVWTSPF